MTSLYAVKLFESSFKLFAHETHSTKFFEGARSRLHLAYQNVSRKNSRIVNSFRDVYEQNTIDVLFPLVG